MHVFDFGIYSTETPQRPHVHAPIVSQCLVLLVVSLTHLLVATEAISVNLHTHLPTITLDPQPLTVLLRHSTPLAQVATGIPLQVSAGSSGNKADARGNLTATMHIPRERTGLPHPLRPLRLVLCRDPLPFYSASLLF